MSFNIYVIQFITCNLAAFNSEFPHVVSFHLMLLLSFLICMFGITLYCYGCAYNHQWCGSNVMFLVLSIYLSQILGHQIQYQNSFADSMGVIVYLPIWNSKFGTFTNICFEPIHTASSLLSFRCKQIITIQMFSITMFCHQLVGLCCF